MWEQDELMTLGIIFFKWGQRCQVNALRLMALSILFNLLLDIVLIL